MKSVCRETGPAKHRASNHGQQCSPVFQADNGGNIAQSGCNMLSVFQPHYTLILL
jgi:hypothetical protein